jgi:hypothetical protein
LRESRKLANRGRKERRGGQNKGRQNNTGTKRRREIERRKGREKMGENSKRIKLKKGRENSHSEGWWNPKLGPFGRSDTSALLYLPRLIVRMENLVE